MLPLSHVEGMLVAYLPDQKMLIEADLFDASAPNRAGASDANRSLFEHVQRLGLDDETIVPIHGKPTSWADFVNILD